MSSPNFVLRLFFDNSAPINFDSWNHFNLENMMITHLVHFREYLDIQDLYNRVIATMKSHLVQRTKDAGMATPYLGAKILK